MVYFKHVKVHLSCLDESKTLLSTPSNYIRVIHEEELKQGCYLYWDTNDCVWIRSGKVTGQRDKGRGFRVRHLEHEKKARARRITSNMSRFYIVYPSTDSERIKSKAEKGVFENLVQYVGVGFDPTNDSVMNTISEDASNGGIFSFDVVDKENIAKLNFRGHLTTKERARELVSYLLELVYDLAISPRDNVSKSLGFESILGAVV